MKKIQSSILVLLLMTNLCFAGESIDKDDAATLNASAQGQPANGLAPASGPPSRAMPSPLDSPPFPNSDWLGPVIGEPDSTPDYPMQKAIFGDALKPSRLKIYGWADVSANYSTSKNSNVPMSYDIVPNAAELEQFVVRMERQPDTVQTQNMDWGFRLSSLYGIDYRWTTAKGWFSDQLLKHNDLYGWDPVECYGLFYVPSIADGLLITAGRFISPPDIEAQMATGNYLFSHSVMFTFDPYTFTGIMGALRLDAQWTLELGVHAGNDMAPWCDSAQPNGHAMVRWVSKDNNDSIWAGLNSIGSGEFRNGHDDLQQLVGTWEHKFSETYHMMTEAYYMWQFDAARGGTVNDGPVEPFGGGGGSGPIIPGYSDAIGVVNYFQIKLSAKDYLSIRNDFLDDCQGQRSGFATVYTSHTLGWSHAFTDLITARPEIRYERSYNVPAYDNGTKWQQFSVAMDVIVRF